MAISLEHKQLQEVRFSPAINHFRLNVFRVLRVTVSASLQEAQWQAEKMVSFASLNLSIPDEDPLPWLLPPNESNIRQAAHVIEQPYERLVQQLLWFNRSEEIDPLMDWLASCELGSLLGFVEQASHLPPLNMPVEGDQTEENTETIEVQSDQTDQQEIALSSEYAIPLVPEIPDAKIGFRLNCANVNLLLAATLLHYPDIFATTLIENVSWTEMWSASLKIWLELLDSPDFSTYVNDVASQLDDELLDDSAAETAARAIKVVLANMLIEEIKEVILRGDLSLLKQLTAIVAKAGFKNQLWHPLTNSIHALLRPNLITVVKQIENPGVITSSILFKYFSDIEEIIQRWNEIDPRNLLQTHELIDEAVLQGFYAITSLSYVGDLIGKVQDLLDVAASTAQLKSTRERIKAYKTQIIKFHAFETCYYCGKKERDQTKPVVIKSKRIDKVQRHFRSRTIHYSIRNGIIPRCEECAAVHKKIYSLGAWAMVGITPIIIIFSIALLGLLGGLIADVGPILYIILIIASLFFRLANQDNENWAKYAKREDGLTRPLRNLVERFVKPDHMRDYTDIYESPAYKELGGFKVINIDIRKNALERASS